MFPSDTLRKNKMLVKKNFFSNIASFLTTWQNVSYHGLTSRYYRSIKIGPGLGKRCAFVASCRQNQLCSIFTICRKFTIELI